MINNFYAQICKKLVFYNLRYLLLHIDPIVCRQYHGGTNFGRVASSYVITGYYDHAPLDEYG